MDQEQAVGNSPVKKNPPGKVRKFFSMNVKMNNFFNNITKYINFIW